MRTISEVRQFYDDIAPSYDSLLASHGWPANTMLHQELANTGCAIGNALDLGAGTGSSTMAIQEATKPERIVAIDISAKMLEKLRLRCASEPRLVIAQLAVDEYLAETCLRFDLVTAIGLLHSIPEPQVVFSGVARVLNPGGRFIFTYDPYIPKHPIHNEAQIADVLTVYRATAEHIEDSLRQNALQTVRNQAFVPKPNSNPLYRNNFVVAKKPVGAPL